MFDTLAERLNTVFKRLKGYGRLSEENVGEALREVRLALLEADVHFRVVKELLDRIRARAIGQEVMESLTPGQQVVKIVHEELVRLLGGKASGLDLSGRQPAVLMLVGLQGSGKTTTAAKLARWLKSKGRRPYLVPADLHRPAAIEQLKTLGRQISVPVHPTESGSTPLDVVRQGVSRAALEHLDTVIVDTAGRLHVDEGLMAELAGLKEAVSPQEILLVVDAMTGQEAVTIAQKFDADLGLTGFILTKLEGDARGGAALSIQYVVGKAIKFVGVGEKLDALEAFRPEGMANRILGMGDVLSLVEKVQQAVDQKKALELREKLRADSFDLDDFKEQIQQIRKLGSLDQILSMIPGFSKIKQLKGLVPDEKELVKIEAIINSMTREERRNHAIINAARRRRIASGSGTSVQDVNKLLKNYSEMNKMLKKMKQGRFRGLSRGLMPFP
ncbi:MAG: signal recognition particle protein [Deltaproteobacteria bacterium]